MSQFEQENGLNGERGGEVDDDTIRDAWRTAEELNDEPIPDELGDGEDDE